MRGGFGHPFRLGCGHSSSVHEKPVTVVEGPTDYGGSVGYFVVVREPSGHLVEFTFGQPLRGVAGGRLGVSRPNSGRQP